MVNPNVREDLKSAEFPGIPAFVEALAKVKAEGALHVLPGPTDLIVAADTVVTFEGKVFGKPVDRLDAIKTLQK